MQRQWRCPSFLPAALWTLVCTVEIQAAPVPVRGNQVVLVAEAPLLTGGKVLRAGSIGEQFEVLVSNASQGQVFVFVVGEGAKKTVASLPLNSVVVVDEAAPAAPGGPPAAPASAPKPNAGGIYAAADVANYFKADRVAATAQFTGKPLKIEGSVERAEIRVGSEGPVLIFSTGPGLPKIKATVHPSISRDSAFYRGSISEWYHDGWYRSGHKLEFRPAGAGLDARFRYKRITTGSASGTKTYRALSEWFPIFTSGDILTASGTCTGLMMDVILEAAELTRPP